MTMKSTRRIFLQRAAVGAAAVTAAKYVPSPLVWAAADAKDKVRVAVIGCGGQGTGTHVSAAVREEKLVAIVDADPKKHANAIKQALKMDSKFNGESLKTFTDYRELFDKAKNDFDAISVATPNHHHALPGMIAMKLGKHVYIEKPLSHNIDEARKLSAMSKEYKVATQLGNQGHSGEGYRRLCEYIWAGAIGNVTEVYCWTNRANGGTGGRPPTEPVPAGMNWDNWIGPAPFRDYHKGLHPHDWHDWFDFGGGSIGNMGCHIMDGALWALKLGMPTTVVVEESGGGSAEQFTTSTRIRFDFAARENMPAVKLYWYDGKKLNVTNAGGGDVVGSVDKKSQNIPPIAEEWAKKTGRNFAGDHSLYFGDKGVMYTGCYGGGVAILPEEAHKAYKAPTPTLPRLKGSHHADFFRACRDGKPACSNFEYGAKLTELILLGGLAIRAGKGNKIEWDAANMKVTNNPDLNKYLTRQNRKGWEA
jgi:predicted dehydrogenase